MPAFNGDKKMDHNEYPKNLRKKTESELRFIRKDAAESIRVNPDNPNNGYYQDEVIYASQELRRRGIVNLENIVVEV